MNKELTWAEHIHRCLELGVSKKAYCEEHNLSYQLFFHHQRKLTESKSSVGFKEILLRNEHMQNRESDDASESVLQVQFANGCTLFFFGASSGERVPTLPIAMIALSTHQRYFLYKGFTDMRKSFDGLCGLVRNELDKDPASGCVFIFFNKPRTHVKILFWERDGFALFYKRLERGTFEVPTSNDENEISSQTLSLILDGIVLSSVKKKRRYSHPA